MPINPELTDDTQDETGNTDQKNQISSGQSVGVSPGSSTSSQAGGASKQGTPTSSGTFTNLNQYVNANKDQSAGLGSKIEQNVQGGANAALGQLSASGQEFNTKEQAAGVNPEDYSQEKIAATAQKALATPEGIGQSDIDKFNEARTKSAQFAAGTDTGPKALTELDSYQTAKNSLTNAAQNAGLTGSESGRDTLLKQTYAKPGYTQGQTNLDQLLTQNVQSNRDKFKDLQNNLLGQYGLASQDASAVQNAVNERQKVSTGTQQAGTNIQNVLLGTPTGDINFPTSTNLDVSPKNITTLANTAVTSDKPVTIGTWALNGWSKDIQIVNENGKPYLYVGGQKASDGTVADLQNLIPAYQAKPGFSLAQITPQITTPQQGILTQYQTQLQAKPGQLNAQQQKTYNDNLAAVTAALQQQYGSTAYGIPIGQVAQQVVNTQSALGSATAQNSYNATDIARLNALNSLAGRESNILGDTKLGDQDKNLFNPESGEDYGAGNRAIQQQANVYRADIQDKTNTALQATQPQVNHMIDMYRSQGWGDRYNDINNYANYAATTQANLADQISKINGERNAMGLPGYNVSAQDMADARSEALNQLANAALGNAYSNDALNNWSATDNNGNLYNQHLYGTSEGASTSVGNVRLDNRGITGYIDDRINSSDIPYSNSYKNLIAQMTQANVYSNLLSKIKQNPYYQAPGATIANAPKLIQ